jgi:hypothetical protein
VKKILLATAAAAFLGLGIGVPAASAGVTPSPSGGTDHTCEATPVNGQINPNFGRGDCTPRPVPVQRNCIQVRVQPYATPSAELSAKITYVGNHPTPQPTPTINPQARCRPEHFDIAQAWTGPRLGVVIANYAQAIGPVNGVGTDTQLSNTLDRLNLGSGRVFLRHNGIGNPIVNLNNCTASLLQFGVWNFNGGTSLNAHAIGNGTYRLALLAHFPVRGNVCSLSLISGNPLLSHRVSPDFLSVGVHGDGLASR